MCIDIFIVSTQAMTRVTSLLAFFILLTNALAQEAGPMPNIECEAGWFDNNGTCQYCGLHCYHCNTTERCQECAPRFTLNSGGRCEYHEGLSGSALGGIIGGGVFFLACMLRIVGSCCCKRQPAPVVDHQDINQVLNHNVQDQPDAYGDEQAVWESSMYADAFDHKTVCTVCLQDGINLLTSCDHGFHVRCFRDWTNQKRNCPNCRLEAPYPIRIYCQLCHKSYSRLQRPRNRSLNKSSYVCDRCQPWSQTRRP